MGFFSKIFGTDLEVQKRMKFQELEQQFGGDSKMINFMKAAWLTSRGNHYGQRNQLDQAITDFKEAITLNPNHAPAHTALGIAYRAKGMFKEAIAILEGVPKESKVYGDRNIDSRFWIYFNLGLVHMDMGDKAKAIEYLEKSLKANDAMVRDSKIIEQQEILKKVDTVNEQDEKEHQGMVEDIQELLKELKGDRV